MSGDPTAARIWADADVYIAFDTSTDDPDTIDDEFPGGWDLVGLLDGDEGFNETRDEDVGDHFAWGGILIRTTRAHFKLTRAFTALENASDTVRRLRWPGSEVGQIVVPRPERVKIAFETTDGDNKHRVISAFEAEVTVNGDIKENETDPASVPFLVTIFPDSSVTPAVLFNEQQTETS